MKNRLLAPLVLAALLAPAFTATAAQPYNLVVAMEKTAYGADESLLEGVRGTVTVTNETGAPLAGVAVDILVFRTSPLGFVQGERHAGVTDADGVAGFETTLAFAAPGSYYVAAYVAGGTQHTNSTRYSVGAPSLP